MTLESIPSKPSSRSGVRASAAFRKARERMLAVLVGLFAVAAAFPAASLDISQ